MVTTDQALDERRAAAAGVKPAFSHRYPMRGAQFLRSNTFYWALMVAGVFADFRQRDFSGSFTGGSAII